MSMIPGIGGSALAVLGVAVALVAACRDDGGSSESTPIAQPASAQLEASGLAKRPLTPNSKRVDLVRGHALVGAAARRCGEDNVSAL
jgi:hypothetical protein